MMNSIMHRNNKQKYYLINYLSLLIPDFYFRLRLNHKLKKIAKSEFDNIKSRLNYYNKLDKKVNLPDETTKLKSFTGPIFLTRMSILGFLKTNLN